MSEIKDLMAPGLTEEPIMVADWGEDVVRQTYPSKSLIDNGVVCAYGSDL